MSWGKRCSSAEGSMGFERDGEQLLIWTVFHS